MDGRVVYLISRREDLFCYKGGISKWEEMFFFDCVMFLVFGLLRKLSRLFLWKKGFF